MSEIKVNKLTPRTNCGTVQLGDSGDTITIPSGVSITNSGTASGFGATGAASWNTTVKTGDFTAVNGEGYFVDTTSGAVNVTLPAGAAGSVIAVKDYAKTFDTNAVTLVRNGSDKIGGQTINATLNIEGQAVTLVFIDSTQGWLVTDSGLQSDANQSQFVTATGGTITTCGNFKIHTFTGPGTFCVSCAGNCAGSNLVDYMIVAGGGSGGCGRLSATCSSGGGGAGGWRASSGTASGSYNAGPGPLTSPVSSLPISVQGYPIVVGAGGASAASTTSNNGSPSSAFSLTSTGGGGGGSGGASQGPENRPGNPGGSGGGVGGGCSPGSETVGAGNTPPVSPPQGNNGGGGTPTNGFGGGGGATAVGGTGTGPTASRAGGAGATSCISASPTAYAGGGGAGGSSAASTGGNASPCGTGGRGGNHPSASPSSPTSGTSGTTNRGGGGGGMGSACTSATSGAGGSGIVIIRYKFQ